MSSGPHGPIFNKTEWYMCITVSMLTLARELLLPAHQFISNLLAQIGDLKFQKI